MLLLRCNFSKIWHLFPWKTVESGQSWFLPHSYFWHNVLSDFLEISHTTKNIKTPIMFQTRFGSHIFALLQMKTISMSFVLIPLPPIPIRVNIVHKLLSFYHFSKNFMKKLFSFSNHPPKIIIAYYFLSLQIFISCHIILSKCSWPTFYAL